MEGETGTIKNPDDKADKKLLIKIIDKLIQEGFDFENGISWSSEIAKYELPPDELYTHKQEDREIVNLTFTMMRRRQGPWPYSGLK